MSIKNNMNAYRKRTGLTLQDVAFLIGQNHNVNVCRYEKGTVTPDLKTIIAYEVLFEVSISFLFPLLYRKYSHQIKQNIPTLITKLKTENNTYSTEQRIHSLERIHKMLTDFKI